MLKGRPGLGRPAPKKEKAHGGEGMAVGSGAEAGLGAGRPGGVWSLFMLHSAILGRLVPHRQPLPLAWLPVADLCALGLGRAQGPSAAASGSGEGLRARAGASPQGLGLRRRRQWASKGGGGRVLLPMDSLRLGAVPRAWHGSSGWSTQDSDSSLAGGGSARCMLLAAQRARGLTGCYSVVQ